jgi:FAD/FMN-containing dehydrogenase
MSGQDALIGALAAIVGERHCLTGEAALAHAVGSWGALGTPIAHVRPGSTADVSAILRLCHDARVPVSAWGGKTGLVQGANGDGAIALSLDRMNAIEEIDVTGGTMTVEAGCILQTAAEAAEARGLLLPIDLGARGSATIGGVISTNAGGNRVIRYGMTRDATLGLEAVLADGTVISSMNRLIKNNTGYDLKQLFIGSEGTLGVVTRAVLRLRPLPASQDTAFVGCARFEQLPRLLRHMEQRLAGTLSAFEVMWREFVDLVTTAPALGRSPLGDSHPFSVLIEGQGGDQEADSARFEAALMEALELGMIEDAAIAKSQGERNAMWALRDDVAQTGRNAPIFTYDVSLPIDRMEAYVEEVRAAIAARWGSAATLIVFGHLGDGNLHLIAGVGSADGEAKAAVNAIVYDGVRKRQGSISAEHGIGLEKRDYLGYSRTPEELALMRRLKTTLDPNNILNPGKIFSLA